jgi:hypothetical protein
VPVKSCWNGLVAFDTEPFYGENPLKFWGVSDEVANLNIEGIERCLIHSDNYLLRELKGVWLNPNVRVAYQEWTYLVVNPTPENMRIWLREQRMDLGFLANIHERWLGWAKLWKETKIVKDIVEEWMQESKKDGISTAEKPLEFLYWNGENRVLTYAEL